MMKKLVPLLLFFFLCTACSRAAIETVTDFPSSAPEKPLQSKFTLTPEAPKTPTNSPSSTDTITPPPSQTPTSAYTPTFDTSQIATVPPSQPEVCPGANPTLEMSATLKEHEFDQALKTPLLEFLNMGGNPIQIIDTFAKDNEVAHKRIFTNLIDVTGDGVVEILLLGDSKILEHHTVFELSILGCSNGEYVPLFNRTFDGYTEILIEDMNGNGIPELTLPNFQCGSGQCLIAVVLEWDGSGFANRIQNNEYAVDDLFFHVAEIVGGPIEGGRPLALIEDIDNNSTSELIIIGDVPTAVRSDFDAHGPWRNRTDVYMWNGKAFVLETYYYSPPEYRFQAVQDGDRESWRGNYELALSFYQAAIENDELAWWSVERKENYYERNRIRGDDKPTPTLLPELNSDYDSLVAYAYYRMILLRLLLEEYDKAEETYITLQQKYPTGSAGYPYVQLATAFWSEYQLHSELEPACSKAVEFTMNNQELLLPLGNTEEHDFHGWQSMMYAPEDICPFK